MPRSSLVRFFLIFLIFKTPTHGKELMKKNTALPKKVPSGHSTPAIYSKKPVFPNTGGLSVVHGKSEEEVKEFSQDALSINEEGAASGNGESVLVAVRVRPMNGTELSRGDEYCLKVFNEREVQIYQKAPKSCTSLMRLCQRARNRMTFSCAATSAYLIHWRAYKNQKELLDSALEGTRPQFCLWTNGKRQNLHVFRFGDCLLCEFIKNGRCRRQAGKGCLCFR